MKEYNSNQEFFVALKTLIERWCDERYLGALATILPSYTAFNGLGDGWGQLFEALRTTRALGSEAFSSDDWETLSDLIHYADIATRRQ
jgi:hypothetical protein